MHAGRHLALREFENSLLDSNLILQDKIKVAVVGGTTEDPEAKLLVENRGERIIDFVTFGIEESDVCFDLNHMTIEEKNDFFCSFDLVICCQVLEHVWNINHAIKQISKLVRNGGFVWINVPASNHKHFSPEYFSAGYQSAFLEHHFRANQIVKLKAGEIGTKRLYHMTHRHLYWPTVQQLRFPILRGVERVGLYSMLRLIKYILRSLEAITWSNKVVRNSVYSTEAFLFGQKRQVNGECNCS